MWSVPSSPMSVLLSWPMAEASTVSWRALVHETAALLGDASEARWICEEVSGCRGAEWFGLLDSPAGTRAVARLDALVARRQAGEPLQYVLGAWPFRHLELFVDQRVLIPRPETEVVVGHALDLLRPLISASRPVVAADLGTGSGAIALSLVSELPLGSAEVWATDVSTDALDVARANLAGIGRRGVGVRLALGSWFDALPAALLGTFDVIVSNPPYVLVDDLRLDASVAEWEPGLALFGGPDGLDAVRVLVSGAQAWLRPGGSLVVEIGSGQGPAVRALALAAGFNHVDIRPDLSGHDRALIAR